MRTGKREGRPVTKREKIQERDRRVLIRWKANNSGIVRSLPTLLFPCGASYSRGGLSSYPASIVLFNRAEQWEEEPDLFSFLYTHTTHIYIYIYIYCSLIIGFIMILSFSPRACSRGHHLLPMEGETEGDQRGTAKGKKGRERRSSISMTIRSPSPYFSPSSLLRLLEARWERTLSGQAASLLISRGSTTTIDTLALLWLCSQGHACRLTLSSYFFFFETRRGWRMKKGTFMHEARSFDPCPFIISLLPASLAGERKLPIVFG